MVRQLAPLQLGRVDDAAIGTLEGRAAGVTRRTIGITAGELGPRIQDHGQGG